MKKIFIVLIAFIIFFIPLHEAYAIPGATKVIGKVAKEVAKDVVVDTAVNMSLNMIMDYKYVPKDGKKAKEGYEVICLPTHKTGDSCSRPMQIKKNIDKKTLKTNVDTSLDKKISGGKGFSRWQKWLDWIAPIWIISAGAVVVDYLINGDVANLFDDIALDALQDSGLLLNLDDSGSGVLDYIGAYEHFGSSSYGAITYVFDVLSENPYYILINEKEYKLIGNNGRSISLNIDKTGIYRVNINGSSNYSVSFERLQLPVPTKQNVFLPKDLADAILIDSGLARQLYQKNVPPELEPLPEFDQLAIPNTNKPGTTVKVPSPGDVPLRDSQTGVTVTPKPQPDGSIGFETPVGEKVPEEDVEIDPDPKKDPNPDPEFPDGESCDAKLKKPRFDKLTDELSSTFPFNIPFDLYQSFINLFVKMGDKKPVFDFKLGDYETKITMPDYFDDWMPFVHTLLIFTFDIGLLFLVYRFIGGSK